MLSFLYVYSDHSILECYNLFSGVELSMRSFFVISASDLAKADDIELQEITENATKSMEDLITQFEGQETLPMHELLRLDKQLRCIRGSLDVEVAKRFSWRKASRKKSASSRKSETILESMTMAFEKTS